MDYKKHAISYPLFKDKNQIIVQCFHSESHMNEVMKIMKQFKYNYTIIANTDEAIRTALKINQ